MVSIYTEIPSKCLCKSQGIEECLQFGSNVKYLVGDTGKNNSPPDTRSASAEAVHNDSKDTNKRKQSENSDETYQSCSEFCLPSQT
jgi:hypothetical protein